MPNFTKTAATSLASGFQNYTVKSGSVVVPSASLPAFSYTTHTITIPLDNANAVSEVQLNVSLDSYWTSVEGVVYRRYPNWPGNYGIDSNVYFSGGNLVISSYLYDQTGSPQVIPAFTISARAFLFKAPF